MAFKTKATYMTPDQSSRFRFNMIDDGFNFERLAKSNSFYCKPDRLTIRNICNISEQYVIVFHHRSNTIVR